MSQVLNGFECHGKLLSFFPLWVAGSWTGLYFRLQEDQVDIWWWGGAMKKIKKNFDRSPSAERDYLRSPIFRA